MAGIALQGAGGIPSTRVRAARVSVNVAGNGTDVLTINWAPAFPDTNYTVVASIVSAETFATLRVDKIVGKSASAISVRVINGDTLQARTGDLQAIAIADA